jgi:predicted CopG family antitoxin
MATKTISIDLAAYEKLRRARIRPDEPFSQVIKRGRWDRVRSTGAALLEALDRAPVLDEDTLRRLESNQRADGPPSAAWSE